MRRPLRSDGLSESRHYRLFFSCVLTVRVAIEIDLREAVSRFLNVCAKSGGQSADFRILRFLLSFRSENGGVNPKAS